MGLSVVGCFYFYGSGFGANSRQNPSCFVIRGGRNIYRKDPNGAK